MWVGDADFTTKICKTNFILKVTIFLPKSLSKCNCFVYLRSGWEKSHLTSKLQTLACSSVLLLAAELKLYSIYEGTSRQVTFNALLVFFGFATLNNFYIECSKISYATSCDSAKVVRSLSILQIIERKGESSASFGNYTWILLSFFNFIWCFDVPKLERFMIRWAQHR